MRSKEIYKVAAGDILMITEYGYTVEKQVKSVNFKKGMYYLEFTNGEEICNNFSAVFQIK